MSDEDDCHIIDSNINYKSITCEKIPELFLDKLVAKKHFGKFGKISRFILRPNRLWCTVDYEKEEDAANALRHGTVFNGHEFTIRYSLHEVKHVQNTEEWVDPDVQAELDIMGNSTRRIPASVPTPVAKLPPLSQPGRLVRPKVPKSQTQETATGFTTPASAPAHKSVPNSVRTELEAILRKPAFTDEEKYRVLDARDKLIRLTTVRTTDIKKVVSIKGTCPDMCPEKERYMREFQHQVSTFETDEGGGRSEMNHNIAIKEYSRSSADQEVPLAHELRPESTLKMTMQYLMHRIMGLCDISDINIGDWFHFVWDRTRSIRKDITQQELCSTGAVELVEQCARFHIHCAARLVAEDPSVFDQKINTENLTKCLQTLKYMYNDLRVQGVRCENEAEFRGFIVLLNLNDANFLWELQDLPEEIQNSKEVRSAIAFYKCMESNNFVRFFNLVKKTSYMNACILLRYFTQVRLKATRMIIKAYNWPRHLVSLPLAHLVKILGFENEDAALDFFSYYGLQCDEEAVVLDKKAFEQPDMPVLMDRAFELVESKRLFGVGEAICGRPLDSPSVFENHQPHNSFDANGYLRYESFSADDQLKNDPATKTTPQRSSTQDKVFKIPLPSPPLMSPKQKLKAMFSSPTTTTSSPISTEDTDFKPIPKPPSTVSAESIFSQTTFNPPTNSSSSSSSIFKLPTAAPPVQAATSSIFGSSSTFQKPSTQTGSIFGGFMSSSDSESPKNSQTNIFGAASQTFACDNIFQHFGSKPLKFSFLQQQEINKQKEEQENEQERLRQQHEEEIIKKQTELEELKKHKRHLEEKLEQERLKEQQRKQALADISTKSEIILAQLLEEVQEDLLDGIASLELYNHRCLDKLAEEIITDCILDFVSEVHANELKIMKRDQSLLFRYFHMWREQTEKRRQRRELIAQFPIWVTTDTLDQHAQKIAHPRQSENLQMIKRYRFGYPCDFTVLLGDDALDPPINIFSSLMRNFNQSYNQLPSGLLKQRKYYKMIISLPDEREELQGFYSYANIWLDRNICRETLDTCPFICSCESNLALCVRKVYGIIPKNEHKQKVQKENDHSDSLIFLMTPGNVLNSKKRLHNLFEMATINQNIPVAILVFNPTEAFTINSTDLDLEYLMNNNKISTFQILNTNGQNMKADFQKSLRFLAQNENEPFPLVAQGIEHFLNDAIGVDLWRRLHKSYNENPSFRKICEDPKHVVDVFNSGIEKLMNIVDEDFTDYPEFPEELREFVPPAKYDIPVGLEQFPDDWKNIDKAKTIVNFLDFVRFSFDPDGEYPKKIDELEIWILDYANSCIIDDDDANIGGYNAIKVLINQLSDESLQELPIEDRFKWISWLPILQEISIALIGREWRDEGVSLPRHAIYNYKEFIQFQTEPWWLEHDVVKAVKMRITPNSLDDENYPNDGDGGGDGAPDLDIVSVIARAEQASTIAEEKLRELQKEAKDTETDKELTKQLDETIYDFEVGDKCFYKSCTDPECIYHADMIEEPMAKKIKTDAERNEIAEAVDRALGLLRQTEEMMDRYRIQQQLIQDVQTLENDYD